ncbi:MULTISPECIES: maleylpyruvate isomerase family mycothiol-dependent enzyme [Actinomycetes]|uniref:Maleylpyruvate isomerase family mycothiol-dependent enzyme n=2 Tax=Actinomycetes TaxID=1760 RepID=A0ABP6M428_9MICC
MRDFSSRPDIDHLALLAALQREFHAHLLVADPDAPVPSCGRWTVRDLTVHLSDVHLWAADMAQGLASAPDEERPAEHPEDLAAHYRSCAAHLHETLTQLSPNAPARILGRDGTASFWRRRQVHETLIHLHDLAESLDAEPPEAGAEVWADGIDEIITVMHPRQVRRGRAEPPSSSVRVTATDAATSWVMPEDAEDPAAEIRGRAQDVALLLWGRRDLATSSLEVRGDRAAVQQLLDQPITP